MRRWMNGWIFLIRKEGQVVSYSYHKYWIVAFWYYIELLFEPYPYKEKL